MKKIDLIIMFFIVILIIAAFAMFTPLLAEQSRLQDEIAKLLEEQQAVKHELSALQKEIDALSKGDPKAIMRVAREKFNYCREGEEIYQLEYIAPEKP
ncbi:MAG: septum formation initiator family protein [Lentisphaeria bacterium]